MKLLPAVIVVACVMLSAKNRPADKPGAKLLAAAIEAENQGNFDHAYELI